MAIQKANFRIVTKNLFWSKVSIIESCHYTTNGVHTVIVRSLLLDHTQQPTPRTARSSLSGVFFGGSRLSNVVSTSIVYYCLVLVLGLLFVVLRLHKNNDEDGLQSTGQY